MNCWTRIVALACITFVAGCTTSIPAKLEVHDVASGRKYTTYQPWGKVTKGIGYEFTDIDSGNKITLTNYEVHTLDGPKSVPSDGMDAKSFNDAKTRGGVQ